MKYRALLQRTDAIRHTHWARKLASASAARIVGTGLALTILLLLTGYLTFISPLQSAVTACSERIHILAEEKNRFSAHNEEKIGLSAASEIPQALDLIRQCLEKRAIAVQEIQISQSPVISTSEFRQSLITINAAGPDKEVIAALAEIQANKQYLLLFQHMDLTIPVPGHTRVQAAFILITL